MSVALLTTTRGGVVETLQRGHVAVSDAHGRLLAHAGSPDAITYPRSAAKPLQAIMVLHSAAARRYALGGRLLAVCCASHRGEPDHVAAVRAILKQADIAEEALQCGVHAPIYQPAAAALWRAGGEPLPVHNNCSGKHAGMLAASRALDAPLENYLSIDHPVQQGILTIVAALSDVATDHIGIGIDGCGVPVHALPLQAMAHAYAYLAAPAQAPELSDGTALGPFLATIAAAMVEHPWYVSGTGGGDTLLMERAGGRLLAKSGADGVLCVAVREAGIGVAIKVESGRNDHIHAVAIAVLHQLGLLDDDAVDELGDLARPPVRNHRGKVVGEAQAVVTLERRA